MRRFAVALALLVALVVLGVVVLWSITRPSTAGRNEPDARTSPTPTRSAAPQQMRKSPAPLQATCPTRSRPFAPTAITVPAIAQSVAVVAPPRDANGVPGIPPLTTEGAHVFAWDREQRVEPGDPHGNVLLNAHTWPDGSALGNHLLAALQKGDRIVVSGGGHRLCYRVTERIEVPAADGFPRYYARKGPPRLAIIVCSGRRLGPGHWENRTIWFAAPGA